MLTAVDRCDRCGAQAFVSAEFRSGALLFCGHHYRKHQNQIDEQAIVVINETKQLAGNRPSISASPE